MNPRDHDPRREGDYGDESRHGNRRRYGQGDSGYGRESQMGDYYSGSGRMRSDPERWREGPEDDYYSQPSRRSYGGPGPGGEQRFGGPGYGGYGGYGSEYGSSSHGGLGGGYGGGGYGGQTPYGGGQAWDQGRGPRSHGEPHGAGGYGGQGRYGRAGYEGGSGYERESGHERDWGGGQRASQQHEQRLRIGRRHRLDRLEWQSERQEPLKQQKADRLQAARFAKRTPRIRLCRSAGVAPVRGRPPLGGIGGGQLCTRRRSTGSMRSACRYLVTVRRATTRPCCASNCAICASDSGALGCSSSIMSLIRPRTAVPE